MTVTAADIKLRFRQFAGTDNDTIDLFIADASQSVNRRVWGNKADLGIIYLTAHMLATSPTADAEATGIDPGVVQSEKVGDMQTNYATSPAAQTTTGTSSEDLSSTKYGRTFVRLRGEILTSPIVLNQSGSLYG